MHITQQLPRESGRDYALRTIKDNIISLDLEPGSKVSENELATALGLSRTPIREALIELSKVDIVEIYPQKGSVISLIDRHHVEQAFFMRETLECEAVRLVCRMAGTSDFEKLEAAIHSQELFVGLNEDDSENKFMELDNAFHELLFEIAEKPLVFKIIQEIVIHFDRIRHMMINYVKPADVLRQHKEILAALQKRDATLAVHLTRDHLGNYRESEQALRKLHPTYFSDMS